MILFEKITAYGHPNIRATHDKTIEITKDDYLTPRGDCIVGVKADKAVSDLDPLFRKALKNDDTVLIIVFETHGYRDIVLAHGSKDLLLTSRDKIIIRKSRYIEPSTIAINANKSAKDLDRRLINNLKDSYSQLYVKLYLIKVGELDYIENKYIGET